MKTEVIYQKCSQWVNDNFNFFNPVEKRKNVDNDLQMKAYIELIFMYNMFFPKRVYSSDIEKKLHKLILNLSKDIDFNDYFLFDPILISGAEVLQDYMNNNNKDEFDIEKFKELILSKLDVLPRRMPYRQLDVAYSLNKIGINSNYPDTSKLYHQTILDHDYNPLYISDDLAYSITHTIFYMTDMGRKIQFSNTQNINNKLKDLITFYELKNNADILSECLICLAFVNRDYQKDYLDIASAAFNVINNNQLDSGLVIAPGESRESLKSNSKEQLFFKNYHTVLVTMGASFLWNKKN
ncbi:hypothetical protein QUW37_06560 [Ligilactobacillus aviarius]|uniref:DUF6895 family protein n=1 Tax=Ligilactobacillus TaxID=2767887 RepID=UPI0025A3237A|nr:MULTISPECIES: hypothetical protein [Ligilactobacillus]MDM8278891.1 hypothetical protein [Ligilactobacillus aviarius]MDO3394035.1 hypothetical protein [Ligilactobacillus sp. 110_WCHN]